MGWAFRIEHSNIVAYLTSLQLSKRPPRLTQFALWEFFGALSGQGHGQPLISSDPGWITEVEKVADESRIRLEKENLANDAQLPDELAESLLSRLRKLLSDYNLFGLAVGSWRDDKELRAFFESAAYSSRTHALFLMAQGGDRPQLEVFDPFPAVALLAQQTHSWPGLLFWTRSGKAAFASLQEAYDLYGRLRDGLPYPEHLDRILEMCRASKEKAKILHLSDLHFGTEESQDKEPYLSTHLHSISTSVGRVVITGDLFNNPKREEARAFHSFRVALSRQRGEDAIVIPGNHDQKWIGNFGSPLKEMAKLEWSSLVVDDKTGCVFFCFDSSRDADLARGKVTVQQRIDVATQFDVLCLARPEVKAYLRIALVHHHPFSFETGKETLIARALERVGITDEYFLRMDDADSFVSWCAGRGVKLILHGHKHVPRYVRKHVDQPGGGWAEIHSVGCGTSLGAEGMPLSYKS